jgi:hypothetical protein
MPNLSGIQTYRGLRQTGAAVDYTVELPAVSQRSLQAEAHFSQTAPLERPVEPKTVLTASFVAPAGQAVSQAARTVSPSVFGLSAKRSAEKDSPGLDQ